jgi:DNA-binding Lrp family transcriptional regulator
MKEEKYALVLNELRKRGRMSLTKLARKYNVPVSSVNDWLNKREDNGIMKVTCILDVKELGYDVRASVLIAVSKDDRSELQSYLINHQNVNCVHITAGQFSFLVDVICRNMVEFDDFIKAIHDNYQITGSETSFIMESPKVEGMEVNFERKLSEVEQ